MVGPATWLYARRHALRCSGGCAWGVYLLSLMLGLIGSAGVFARLSRTEPRRVRLLK